MWLAGRHAERPALGLVVGVAPLCAATLVELVPAAVPTAAGVAAATVACAVAGQGFAGVPTAGVSALVGLRSEWRHTQLAVLRGR